MSNEHHDVLVLRDQDGSYYLLPRETLERLRVPAERTADLKRVLARDDVAGYAFVTEGEEAPPPAAAEDVTRPLVGEETTPPLVVVAVLPDWMLNLLSARHPEP